MIRRNLQEAVPNGLGSALQLVQNKVGEHHRVLALDEALPEQAAVLGELDVLAAPDYGGVHVHEHRMHGPSSIRLKSAYVATQEAIMAGPERRHP